MKAIILAGGAGTRLWPMSRSTCPKQFTDLIGEESLICDTYRRLLRWLPQEKIYFSISPGFEEHLHVHLPEVPPERIFIEPEKRDTGPAMGYVAALLELSDPDEPIVFVPSDHYIKDEEKFLRCLQTGERLILETGKLLDISIEPQFPSTVLGYTHVGDVFEEKENIRVYTFLGHTEKPSYEIAKQYLTQGDYLWHANYYMWTPRKFMEAFDTCAPQMGKVFRQIQECLRERTQEGCAKAVALYGELPKISFDYAVTEEMDPQNVLVIRGDFGWSDIGAWDTLYHCLSQDGYQNVVKGDCLVLDSTGSLVYGVPGKKVAVLGAQDLIVVDTEDALLVCRKDQAQRVKEIVQLLSQSGHQHLL